ncbi:hypothetical protein HNQ71_004547 [Mesorhizobium sangaii]|uniref:Uncharacterized protein n=1 Tax=Mesorhizobium sangaii TaxID=505389 RepID=A0A841PP07_9HYPH|nr:hypothetical protein [Mesorhizobium sangaii]
MRERNRKLINSNGDRELWQSEIQQPDGQWVTLYRGKEFLHVQGVRKQTPDDAAFYSKAEAHAWLLQS